MGTIVGNQPPAGKAQITTYADLKLAFRNGESETINAPGLSEAEKKSKLQHLNNVCASLDRFREYCGFADEMTAIGPEFGDKHKEKAEGFLNSIPSKNLRNNRKSHLKTWKFLWDSIRDIQAQGGFSTFRDAFVFFFNKEKVKKPDLSYSGLAKVVGMHKGTICKYAAGTVRPTTASLDIVKKLETELCTPSGALTAFVPKDRAFLKQIFAQRTPYSAMVITLANQRYSLREDEFSEHLKADVRKFLTFKTAVDPYPLKRNVNWSLSPADRFSGLKWLMQYSTTDDGRQFAASGAKFCGALIRFFGALRDYEVEGHHPYTADRFRLVWMADASLLKIFITFLHNRMGRYTVSAREMAKYTISLVLGEFGYVRQHSELGALLPTPVDPYEWDEWCDAQKAEVDRYMSVLKDGHHIKMARDPKERIQDYLNRDEPLTILLELQRNIRAYLDNNLLSDVNRIVIERDYLLIRMMSVQPLRIKMFWILTYLSDNSGNMYKRTDGNWALRFCREDFKNQKGTATEMPYDVPFEDQSIGVDIERYIESIRGKFNDPSNNVFVARESQRKVKGRRSATLQASFALRTRQFLPSDLGFGPHAVRHIVATDYLKNHPGHFDVAAAMLHDKLVTVIKEYGHLTTQDSTRFWQRYFAEVHDKFNGTSKAGPATVSPELLQSIADQLKNTTNIPGELRVLLDLLVKTAGKAE